MPNYEYVCECGSFEVFHKMDEKGPSKCPKCEKKVKRVIARPAFHTHYSPCHPRATRGRGH